MPECFFTEQYDLSQARPAEYNPRKIDQHAISMLAESIKVLGMCKPIIVRRDGLIVAGHQRTRALRNLGISASPAVILDGINLADEVTFNQLHNGTDLGATAEPVTLPRSSGLGYMELQPGLLQGDARQHGAGIRSDISRLIAKYGTWGSCVATQSGEVLDGGHYALACRTMGVPIRVCYIPDALRYEAANYLDQTYGVFSYDHLPKETYIQSLAQPYRLKHGTNARRSVLYEDYVIPTLNKARVKPTILDFGCGRGDYVSHIGRYGVEILGLEFFRLVDQGAIHTRAVHAMIDAVLGHVETRGLFDMVICDTVLNSVDSMQAHDDVLACCNAFCKPGGEIFISGRTLEHIVVKRNVTAARLKDATKRYTEFLDADGFTANYRKGHWFYQKYHSKPQVEAMAAAYIGPDKKHNRGPRGWKVQGRKSVELPWEVVRGAVEREFNLPWPGGARVGRHAEAVKTLAKAREAYRTTGTEHQMAGASPSTPSTEA